MACNADKQLITTVHAVAGSTVVLLARVTTTTAVNVVQADVTSVRVDVNEVTDANLIPVDEEGEEVTDGSAYQTPVVADVVFNTLQTDSRWDVDSTGYNVAYKFTAPKRDKTYDVRVTLAMENGDTLVLPFEVISK